MKKVLKIILSIIFVPIIIGDIGAIISYIGNGGIEYLITAILIEIFSIWAYIKLMKKVDNMEIKKFDIGKSKQIIVKNSKSDINNQQKYNKITDNFVLNETENKIIINGKIYEFPEIISAELKEDEVGSNVISGIGNSHNSYNTLYGIGINKKMISRLTLEIKTNNINNPFVSISFLETKMRMGYYKNSKKYNEAYQKAQHCLSVLELIIKDNNKNNVEI